jgi:hypothetical protein
MNLLVKILMMIGSSASEQSFISEVLVMANMLHQVNQDHRQIFITTFLGIID